MASISDVEKRIWLAANLAAARANFAIAPDCATHLGNFLNEGVKRLAREAHLDDAERIAFAEANATAFVLRMVIEARELGMNELHEPTFFATKTALCPIWPFC